MISHPQKLRSEIAVLEAQVHALELEEAVHESALLTTESSCLRENERSLKPP
jgi:hypothetical protein